MSFSQLERNDNTQKVNLHPDDKFKWLKKIESGIVLVNTFTHRISMIILLFLMFLTFGDVTGRYFFSPIKGTFELSELSLAVMVFFSLGYTHIKKGHIEIDILVERFPSKVQALLECLTYLLCSALILVTSWRLVIYGLTLKEGGNVTGDLGLPVYIFVFIGAIGLFLFALTLLIDFCKSVYRVVKKNES